SSSASASASSEGSLSGVSRSALTKAPSVKSETPATRSAGRRQRGWAAGGCSLEAGASGAVSRDGSTSDSRRSDMAALDRGAWKRFRDHPSGRFRSFGGSGRNQRQQSATGWAMPARAQLREGVGDRRLVRMADAEPGREPGGRRLDARPSGVELTGRDLQQADVEQRLGGLGVVVAEQLALNVERLREVVERELVLASLAVDPADAV